MFTTRHYSFMSITGILIGVFCAASISTSIIHSYYSAGNIDAGFGGIGLFSMLLNVIGIFCGIVSLRERDIYITPAIVAIVLNGIMVAFWIIMIIISLIGT